MSKSTEALRAYTHLPQGEAEIGPSTRFYTAQEKVMRYKGRDLLYLLVEAEDMLFCDRRRAQHLENVAVPGYIVNWQTRVGEGGARVSDVEPVRGEEEREEIRALLQKEREATVTFW